MYMTMVQAVWWDVIRSSNVMNGIAFGQSSQARYIKSKQSFDIVYTIEENTYKRGELQLQIEDIRPSDEE